MRIGIIGAGVSGMTAAWLLQHDHQVTLIDKASRLGGHAETLRVDTDRGTIHTEFGTRFFFDSAYPYFLSLLRVLGVPVRWTDAAASFTDRARKRTVVLPPRTPRHVASLIGSPRLVRHALSMRRLVEEQAAVAARRDHSVTFRRHLADGRYPPSFGKEFAYPFLAACWGAPLDDLPDFPAYSLLKGMPPGKRPGFYEIPGGMSRYIETLGSGVRRVDRHEGFRVEDARGHVRRFDRLIVATSARDASELLGDAPAVSEMRTVVGSFRHFETEIVVHGDRSLMPPDRRDWSHVNLVLDGETAWMSDWQGLAHGQPVFRTWLPKGRATPSPLYGRRSYHHLVMTPENAILQRRIASLQGSLGLWVTGMYAVDVDNHESALLSGLVPALVLAPQSQNLVRLLGEVAHDAPHRLDILPVPLSRPAAAEKSPPGPEEELAVS